MHGRVRDRVDRSLGQIIAIGGLISLCGLAVTEAGSLADYAWWWLLLCSLTALCLAVLSVAGHVLPMRALRFGWVAVPALVAIAQVTTYFAYDGPLPKEMRSWLSIIAPSVVISLLLWMPVNRALITACVISVLPAVSSLLAFGPVVTAAWTNTPYYLSTVAVVLLFVLIRGSLLQLRIAEAAAEDQELRRAHAVSRASEEARLERLVHDEVLASFSVAMHTAGAPTAALQDGSAEALRILETEPYLDAVGGDTLSGTELGAQLHSLAEAYDCSFALERAGRATNAASLDAALSGASVPAPVAETLFAATTEALRNSVRHAGEGARRGLRCIINDQMVRITVADDGVGFDRSAIDPRRFGVRRSIIASVEALHSGSASVISAPGQGTKVVLEWLK